MVVWANGYDIGDTIFALLTERHDMVGLEINSASSRRKPFFTAQFTESTSTCKDKFPNLWTTGIFELVHHFSFTSSDSELIDEATLRFRCGFGLRLRHRDDLV